MKRTITLAYAVIIAIHLFGQHTSEKVRIKNDIRNDLTELESIYLDKLSYREGKRAEMIVDNIMESVDKLSENRHPHTQPEHSVNRRAERGISEEEFQAMLGNLEEGFHNDMHYSHYRFDPAVYCLSADQMDELVQFFSGRYVTMLSPGEFNILKKETDKAFPDSEKQLVIAKKAIQYYFTVDQVILLLEKFSFDKDKIALIDLVFPKIVDKEMSYRLYDTLTFSSSKDELRNVIDGYMGR